jgi:ATP phosphoribosyltransferase regulatory subunit
MENNNIYTVDGFKDILFDECEIKVGIESELRKVFKKNEFREVQLPMIEYLDVFQNDMRTFTTDDMFKIFDKTGKTLVLRPDVTESVARIAATKFKDAPKPLKFSYIGNVFSFHESGGGKLREYTQAGVELITDFDEESVIDADAKIIITAIESAKAAGLEEFQIDIGQADFFNGLMEEAGLDDLITEEIRQYIDKKNMIGIESVIYECDLSPEMKELILNLPRLFGNIDQIKNATAFVKNKKVKDSIDNLSKVIELVSKAGYEKYVSVDLGFVQKLNYYTGIIFRGFTYGIGYPFLGGGRYDNLVGQFGTPCRATGFAIGINLLMSALERQKSDNVGGPCDE